MEAARKFAVFIMTIVFLAGAVLFVYPLAQGAMLDRQVRIGAESFMELVQGNTERKVNKPNEQPTPDTPSHTPTPAENVEPTNLAAEPVLYADLWTAANEYNLRIWQDRQSGFSSREAYQEPCLDLADYGLSDGIFAVMSIPSIELEMPIYLGASNEHLALGAAHMSQTSLPVGGENSNCVLAGHRGWQNGRYFKRLNELSAGDTVQIINLWETLSYKVSEVHAIEPHEVDSIMIQDGRDLLTLLTCYYGSSHKMRLAVICERTSD